jgi:hypothetical protein
MAADPTFVIARCAMHDDSHRAWRQPPPCVPVWDVLMVMAGARGVSVNGPRFSVLQL